MAGALLSPPLNTSNPLFPPNIHILRKHRQTFPERGRCRIPSKNLRISAYFSEPISETSFSVQTHLQRRDMMVFGLCSSASFIFPSPDSFAADGTNEAIKMALLVDDINAYSFLYPVELSSKKFVFKWVESRKPERYSSAAPLSPDARQRIVSERVDIIDNVVISVSIGPPNSRLLTSQDKKTWEAKDVADSVLSDKSALRVTSSQRMAESSVLDAHSDEIDGEPYWYYEYLVRKSPTKSVQESNLYRHYVASTAERDDGTFLGEDCGFLSPSSSNRQLCPAIQGPLEILVMRNFPPQFILPIIPAISWFA